MKTYEACPKNLNGKHNYETYYIENVKNAALFYFSWRVSKIYCTVPQHHNPTREYNRQHGNHHPPSYK